MGKIRLRVPDLLRVENRSGSNANAPKVQVPFDSSEASSQTTHLTYVSDDFIHRKTVFIESDEEPSPALPEQQLWRQCLEYGFAEAIVGTQREVDWILSLEVFVGSFEWICTDALHIKYHQDIRRLVVDHSGKWKSYMEFWRWATKQPSGRMHKFLRVN